MIRRGTDLLPLPTPLTTAELIAQYRIALGNKIHIQSCEGIEPTAALIHPALRTRPFEHQGAIVEWALRGGKRLIAAQFGLGKTTCQCELMRQIHLVTGGKTLIIGELNVKYQFQSEDGPRLGMDIIYVRNDAEVAACPSPYMYTNYERVRDGGISPDVLREFTAVTLDEASVLADYGSKTFQTFCTLFEHTQYKFAATATPARNKYKELLHYAHFLGVADSGQALTKYFKRNSLKANELTLMESMEQEFWLWVSSWALFVERPSDLGYPDDGYIMPELRINWTRIATDHLAAQEQKDSWGQHFLIANAAAGVTAASREKRRSMDDRMAKAKEIVDAHPGESFILWHHLEDERRYINKLFPGCVDVYGSQDIEEKEERLIAFSRGEFQYLSTKPSIAGKGCNFQHHCHNMIFTGIGYSFEEIIQAIHRLYRFMQQNVVNVWFIFTEAEEDIVNAIKKKWQQHRSLVENTTAIIKRYGLAVEAMKAELRRSMHNSRRIEQGQLWTAINNDAVEELANFADNSLDLICTSIPFGTQYEYTESYNDFGHNPSNDAFWEQMGYLIPQLLRTIKPGRIAAIHVKDRIRFGNVTGYGVPTIEPFSDDCSYAFRKHGFLQLCRITVVNDVVRENNQTYRLTYSEMVKDGTKMGSGTPEYWLIFRKPQSDTTKAYADVPVVKSKADSPLYHWQITASELWRSSGDRLVKPEEAAYVVEKLAPDDLVGMEINQIYNWYKEYSRTHTYDLQEHMDLGASLDQAGRLPKTFMLFAPDVPDAYKETVMSVHDYSRMNVLNARQMARRQENHVCPLPLDLIERIIDRFSMPNEIVYDPFGGIGSTVYQAIKMGRRGIMTELNTAYWNSAVHYLSEIEIQHSAPTLFDLMEMEVA